MSITQYTFHHFTISFTTSFVFYFLLCVCSTKLSLYKHCMRDPLFLILYWFGECWCYTPLRCEHMEHGLGMGSWHNVVPVWSVSHEGHKWGMGYVTWWASRCHYLTLMSHDGRDYLAHSLGKGLSLIGCSLGVNYVIWSLDTQPMVGQSECRCGNDCISCWST